MNTFRLLLLATLNLFTTQLAQAMTSEVTLPFELHRGHFILVKGFVKEVGPLDLVLDTGASQSVLDQRVVRKLGLRALGQSAKVEAFGRHTTALRVLLAGLRLGTHLTSLVCWVEDLSSLKVDGILGLDFLRRQSLTIDFERQLVEFGASNTLRHEIPFEPHAFLIVVQLNLDGQERSLSVDTGIPWLLLYRHRVPRRGLHTKGSIRFVHLNGPVTCPEVWLNRVQVGSVSYSSLYAYLLPKPSSLEDRDGNLGPRALGWVRVHFDFQQQVLGWEG